MNRLGRDTQMCVHITKRQKYTEPNIRFSLLLGLHITGAQMFLLAVQGGGNFSVCVFVWVLVLVCTVCVFCAHAYAQFGPVCTFCICTQHVCMLEHEEDSFICVYTVCGSR